MVAGRELVRAITLDIGNARHRIESVVSASTICIPSTNPGRARMRSLASLSSSGRDRTLDIKFPIRAAGRLSGARRAFPSCSGHLLSESETTLFRYFVPRQLTFVVAGNVPFIANAAQDLPRGQCCTLRLHRAIWPQRIAYLSRAPGSGLALPGAAAGSVQSKSSGTFPIYLRHMQRHSCEIAS